VPYLLSAASGSISGDLNIARYLCRVNQPALLHAADAWLSSQVDQWIEFASTSIGNAINLVETHLSQRTFLVGKTLSLADIAVFAALSGVDVKGQNEHIEAQYRDR
jgi:glutamyl-tRNA synthetase